MTTFYEILNIDFTSDSKTIEYAIEAQYNQVRKLTVHHDSNIVNQANQALAILEQARTILLDPAKRIEYDAFVGQKVGGLSLDEPISSQVTQNRSPIPLFHAGNHPSLAQAQGDNSLKCPKCGHNNSKGTMYCTSCSEAVGRICPNCQTSYEAKSSFCPGCGQTFDIAQKRSLITAQLSGKKIERNSLPISATTANEAEYIEYAATFGLGLSIFSGALGSLFLFFVPLGFIFSYVYSYLPDKAQFTIVINILSSLVSLSRWFILVITLFFIIIIQLKLNEKFKISTLGITGSGIILLFSVLLSGPSFADQVINSRSNSWLILPSLLVGGTLMMTWYLTKAFQFRGDLPVIKNILINKVINYYHWLVVYFDQNSLAAYGIGVGLAFVSLIFSAVGSFFSIIGGLASLCASIFLVISSYRAFNVIEIARQSKMAQIQAITDRQIALDAEIEHLEKQLSGLI